VRIGCAILLALSLGVVLIGVLAGATLLATAVELSHALSR
jgi:hypothetical protein